MENDRNAPSTLPDSLSNHFASSQGQVEAHVHLSGAPDGTMAGETHVVLFQGRLHAFSRKSFSAPFQWVPLADELPRLEKRGESLVLVLIAGDGSPMVLPVSPLEQDTVRKLVDRMEAAEDDAEDAATEVWETDQARAQLAGAPVAKTPSKTKQKQQVKSKVPAEVTVNVKELHQRFRAHITEDNDLDAAYCVADALVFMGQAEEGVAAFHEHHRPQSLLRAQKSITPELWDAHVQHPGEDSEISLLMAHLAPVVASVYAHKPKAFALRDQDLRDERSSLLMVCKVFDFVTDLIGLGTPRLYLKKEQPGGLAFAHTIGTPSFVAGAALLKGRHQSELMFTVASQVAMLRPSYFLCLVLPSPIQLRQVVLGAIRLFMPKLPIPKGETKSVDSVTKVLRKGLAGPSLEAVRALVGRLTSRQDGVDLDDWYLKVQLTADRAGLLLCQQLRRAVAVISEAPEIPGGPTTHRRIQDLTLYALSREYAAARAALGLATGA